MAVTVEAGPLGPKQIAWCRKYIGAFDLAWRAVQAADAHKAKVYDQMGVAPGQLATETVQ